MAEYDIQMHKFNGATQDYDNLYPLVQAEGIIDSALGLLPTINITVDTGSTVTATKDSVVLTETAVDGKCSFKVDSFGTWKLKAVKGGETAELDVVVDKIKVYEVELAYAKIYGVQWDGTANTKWARTDEAALFPDPNPAVNNGTGSSPFDNIKPWSGMVRSTDTQAGEVVSIPKFWYKWTKVGNGLKLQISTAKVNGFYCSPAHMDREDGKGERDVVYVGRYHCSSSNWKSVSGHTPKNNITRSQARSSIHSLGGTIWQWDWHMHMTIWMLYLVEFADWNCQTTIGYGCGNNSGVEKVGRTDSMKYHTGTSWPNRTTYGVGLQYRYIEGLWDNVRNFVDGCYCSASGLNIINNPIKFSDNINGTTAGVPSLGYPSKFEVKTINGFQIIYPTQSKGSDSTYTCDFWEFYDSVPCLSLGSDYHRYLSYGIGYVVAIGASDSDIADGSRLMKLP